MSEYSGVEQEDTGVVRECRVCGMDDGVASRLDPYKRLTFHWSHAACSRYSGDTVGSCFEVVSSHGRHARRKVPGDVRQQGAPRTVRVRRGVDEGFARRAKTRRILELYWNINKDHMETEEAALASHAWTLQAVKHDEDDTLSSERQAATSKPTLASGAGARSTCSRSRRGSVDTFASNHAL